MKVLLSVDNDIKSLKIWLNYIRHVWPEIMMDVILIDLTVDDEVKMFASGQNDITYVYFEEEITTGKAFNTVIKELAIEDDILISDVYHLPLLGGFAGLREALYGTADAFAAGPLSNSFVWEQHIEWKDAEDAFEWSEICREGEIEEVLLLNPGVILFCKNVVDQDSTFDDEAPDVNNMIIEKCIREFIDHGRMYVNKSTGFWDTRSEIYSFIDRLDLSFLEKKHGIHYLNVRGNGRLVERIKDCDISKDSEIKVLEVGCDCGGTLFRIKKAYPNARLYGSDINEKALKYAAEFAEVRVNNIEDRNLDFGINDFDIIIFGDVLEHLRDPLSTLLYCRELLKPGGRVAASIPNLMNIEVIKYLLDGYFPYSEAGLLDKTHIHMFTYNQIIMMFENEAGYKIEQMSMFGDVSSDDEKLIDELTKLGKAEKFMYQAYQYQVIARVEQENN